MRREERTREETEGGGEKDQREREKEERERERERERDVTHLAGEREVELGSNFLLLLVHCGVDDIHPPPGTAPHRNARQREFISPISLSLYLNLLIS